MIRKLIPVFAVLILLLCAFGKTPAGPAGTRETSAEAQETAAETKESSAEAQESTTQEETEAMQETTAAKETIAETLPETEPETAAALNPEEAFYIRELDDALMARIRGKSFKENCTVPAEDLRYLHVLHRNLEGETLEGEMICNKRIAADVLEILRELYENNYPIEKIRLVDEYDAVDEASMADNNSSSFNFRFVSYTTSVSKHGYGLAVDINPLYNPYTKMVNGKRSVEPANGWPYLDRDGDYPYKITRDDLCCRLFLEHGFTWGGDWQNSKDYQHFELPTSEVRKLYPQ